MSARPSRFLRATTRAFFYLAFAVLISEVAVRLFAKKMEPLSLVSLPPVLVEAGIAEYDGEAGWRLPGGLRNFPAFGTSIQTNARGFRMDEEVARKPRKRLRVLCLGGGQTFGVGMEKTAIWPSQFEKKLKEAFPAHELDVVNASCPGDSILRGEARLPRLLAELNPDFVIFEYFEDDLAVEGILDSEELASPAALRRLAAWSQLATHVLAKFRVPMGTGVRAAALPRVSLEDHVLAYLRVKRMCFRAGVGFSAVAPLIADLPSDVGERDRVTDYRESLAGVAAWHQVALHSFSEMSPQTSPEASRFFASRYRLSAEGHRELARLLTERMSREIRLRFNEIAENYPGEMKGFVQ
jgi:hypothetical protein